MAKVAYVREITDKDPVGMFVFHSEVDLFWTIDEKMNPYLCEYCLVPSGCGVHFTETEECEDHDGVEFFKYYHIGEAEMSGKFFEDNHTFRTFNIGKLRTSLYGLEGK